MEKSINYIIVIYYDLGVPISAYILSHTPVILGYEPDIIYD